MRGSPHAECPQIMSLSADCPADAFSPDDGGATSSSAAVRVARCPAIQREQDLQDKPILAPPMFIFQRMTAPLKRPADEDGSGAGVNKRIRSFTYPPLLSRTRKGACDGGRRARSASLSFPPPSPAQASNAFTPSSMHNLNNVSAASSAQRVRVKSTLLRPASLVAPKPHGHVVREVGHDADSNISRVMTGHPSSSDTLEQWMLPQSSRSQANSAIAGGLQFVFGENMSERVLRKPCREDASETDSSSDSDSCSTEGTNKMTVRHTLWESAAAYTASCRRRCLLKQVRIITGEENESNVVQLMCKLFVLERGSQSWSERGRGVLRLNDLRSRSKGCLQSRMVMRNQGSLKLILNTKLYPHTHLRRPARRNLQVMATDLESHGVRVFLIQANARDIARLYVAIHHRLVALRCSAAFREKEGHCTSEEQDNDEDEETHLVKHKRNVDYNQGNSLPRTCA